MWTALAICAATIALIALIWYRDQWVQNRRQPKMAEWLLYKAVQLLSLRPDLHLVSAHVESYGAIVLECMDAGGRVRVFRFELNGNGLWVQVPSRMDIDVMRKHFKRGKFIDEQFLGSRQFASGIPFDTFEWQHATVEAAVELSRELGATQIALN